MRTIKFRGKRIDNGVWVYGYYFIAPLTIENFGIGRLSTLNEKTIHCIADLGGVAFHVDKMTISQFTGMQDIHGKDIYEGDIVNYRTQRGSRRIDSDFDEWTSEVEYSDGAFHPRYIEEECDDPYYNFKSYHLEKIGDKFDDPELFDLI